MYLYIDIAGYLTSYSMSSFFPLVEGGVVNKKPEPSHDASCVGKRVDLPSERK